jgi:sugar O-acyltransferase (sialic acid O-acetyltransferase NeuD family)
MSVGDLLLVGAGGHARSCIDIIEQEGKFNIVGLIGLSSELGKKILDYDVIGTDTDLPNFRSLSKFALVTVGQIGVSKLRSELYSKLLSLDFTCPTVISPLAYISPHARIGSGTFVMHFAVINAGAHVGENCIVNSRALIEHDVTVDDHCHISTGAILNGGSSVGSGSFVGSGSIVRESIKIGRNSLLGMGSTAFSDLPENSRGSQG